MSSSSLSSSYRTCCSLKAFEEALTRETFGKQLIKHQLIRFKLSEMARQVEALYAMLESVAYQFKAGVKDFSLGWLGGWLGGLAVVVGWLLVGWLVDSLC